MVYIHSWQEYQDAAEALYIKSPNTTRYVVKWKASEGKLVLKITDNVSCIKFKTYSSIFLNRFEALNLSLMEKMQNRRRPPTPPPPTHPAKSELLTASRPGSAVPGGDASRGPSPAPAAASAPGASASGGGVKKKKPKKKK